MTNIYQLAYKNLFRNKRRNISVGLGIFISVSILSFVLSFSKGIGEQLITRMVNNESGVVNVNFKNEYLKNREFSNNPDVIQKIESLKKISNVDNLRQRINVSGYINFNNKSTDINIRGINPNNEKEMLNSLKLISGNLLSEDDFTGILVSNSLASRIGLSTGDYCYVLAQTIDGTINLLDASVSGIFMNYSQWEKSIVYANMEWAKQLYNIQVPTKILLDSKFLNKSNEISKQVKTVLKYSSDTNMEIKTFQKSMGMASNIANANRIGYLFIVIFLLILSLIGIVFLILNLVSERMGEIGTLLTLGFSSALIRKIFLFEIFFLAFISSFLAIILTIICVLSLNRNGINVGESASIAFGTSLIYPVISLKIIVISIFTGLGYPTIAGLWATKNINKINPIDSLRRG